MSILKTHGIAETGNAAGNHLDDKQGAYERRAMFLEEVDIQMMASKTEVGAAFDKFYF